MASAFPSRGVGHPAARLAVRGLGVVALGPGGEVRGGVAVAVDGQAAAVAAEGPLGQPHLLLDRSTPRARLGGWEPAVAEDQFSPEPHRLVAELADEFGPDSITDGAGQVPVGHEVSNNKIFQAKPIVSLDELAGD